MRPTGGAARTLATETNDAAMLAAALIDTTALWKIVVASLVGGVGVVVAFGLLLFSLSKSARPRPMAGPRVGRPITW